MNYFYPSQNGLVFYDPALVTNQEDLETLFKKVGDMDWMEWMRKEKPNSKWRIAITCGVAICICNIIQMPIGRRGQYILPSFIVENRGVDALEKS